MSLRVMILGVNRKSQERKGVDYRGRNFVAGPARALLGQRSRELFQSPVDFLEGFRPGGKQALQSDAQVSLEHVFLPALGIIWIALVNAQNEIASLMFREVHRGI